MSAADLTGPLPEAEYRAIFQKVPRLTVEVVICSDLGVLLARRIGGPCDGLWSLPEERSGSRSHWLQLSTGSESARSTPMLSSTNSWATSSTRATSDRASTRPWAWRSAPIYLQTRRWQPCRIGSTGSCSSPDDMHDEQRVFLQAHGLAS